MLTLSLVTPCIWSISLVESSSVVKVQCVVWTFRNNWNFVSKKTCYCWVLSHVNIMEITMTVSPGPPHWSTLTYLNNDQMDFLSRDLYVLQRMNPTDFGDPLTFPLTPPWGRHLWFSVKYLDYWMDCHWISYSCSSFLKVKVQWFRWSPDLSFSATSRSKFLFI